MYICIMVKYKDYHIVFQEIPNRVSLAFNITNCQNNCIGCHSPELRGNLGEELTTEKIITIVKNNYGVDCVLFMGEGNDIETLKKIALDIKTILGIKVAIYSGRDKVEDDFFDVFDYVKVGSYKAKYGPLNKKTTNQHLFMVEYDKNGAKEIKDITNLFW